MKNIILMITFTLSHLTLAQELDASSTEALHKTQELLKNSKERNENLKQNADGTKWDNKIDQMVGNSSEQKEQLYQMSSGIFKNITEQAGGDPEKMKLLLQKAMQDPEGFYNQSLTPEQQKEIQDYSKRLPAAQGESNSLSPH